MPNFDISTFTGSDFDGVLDVWNQSLRRDPIDAARFTPWLLGDPDYWPGEESGMFIARSSGRVVGFARAIIRRHHNERLGVEPAKGWLPAFGVHPEFQRQGVGKALITRTLDHFRSHGRKEIWIAGGAGSAPGYICPGVDVDAYAAGLSLLLKHGGFAIHHHAVSMARETFDFDLERFYAEAWNVGGDVTIEHLSPRHTQSFLEFLANDFPGDWTGAARPKIRGGRFHEVLIARRGDKVVGYCQWEGEHFGPFGVAATQRNAKLGAKLFVEAVRRIRAADGRSVWFNWADPDAQRFYERYGFKPTRRFAILHRSL